MQWYGLNAHAGLKLPWTWVGKNHWQVRSLHFQSFATCLWDYTLLYVCEQVRVSVPAFVHCWYNYGYQQRIKARLNMTQISLQQMVLCYAVVYCIHYHNSYDKHSGMQWNAQQHCPHPRLPHPINPIMHCDHL